jgi:RNA polymerase primary sigma factor
VLDLMEDEAMTHLGQAKINEFFHQEAMQKLMTKLNDREKDILAMRFGIGDGEIKTLDDAAKRFKITRERVRQIEEAALRKLRKYADEIQFSL